MGGLPCWAWPSGCVPKGGPGGGDTFAFFATKDGRAAPIATAAAPIPAAFKAVDEIN
jgi:hypothetical protein